MPLTCPRIQLLGSGLGHDGSTVNAAPAVRVPEPLVAHAASTAQAIPKGLRRRVMFPTSQSFAASTESDTARQPIALLCRRPVSLDLAPGGGADLLHGSNAQ